MSCVGPSNCLIVLATPSPPPCHLVRSICAAFCPSACPSGAADLPPTAHLPSHPTTHLPSAACQVQPVCMCASVWECPALTKGYHKIKHVHIYVFTAIFLLSPRKQPPSAFLFCRCCIVCDNFYLILIACCILSYIVSKNGSPVGGFWFGFCATASIGISVSVLPQSKMRGQNTF